MELYPLGVRRDGSYYTRIEWATHTESDPTFWVVNLIRDDTERNGGTWGANTKGPASVVLSFFGETQTIRRIRIFRNVGLDISVLEELAKTIDLYISNTDEPRKLRWSGCAPAPPGGWRWKRPKAGRRLCWMNRWKPGLCGWTYWRISERPFPGPRPVKLKFIRKICGKVWRSYNGKETMDPGQRGKCGPLCVR